MMKNPFYSALYVMLLDSLKPRSIVEISSAYGGFALFFRDQTQIRGLGTKVWSPGVNPIHGHDDKLLQFLQGDIYCLNQSALPKILSETHRPLPIIADGPHTFEGSLAALNFFVPYMKSGDIIMIEDENLRDLGRGYDGLRNGPHRAINRFMSDNPGKLQISNSLCDFCGRNVT